LDTHRFNQSIQSKSPFSEQRKSDKYLSIEASFYIKKRVGSRLNSLRTIALREVAAYALTPYKGAVGAAIGAPGESVCSCKVGSRVDNSFYREKYGGVYIHKGRVAREQRTERYRLWRVGAISHSEEGSERKGAKGEEECDHETWC